MKTKTWKQLATGLRWTGTALVIGAATIAIIARIQSPGIDDEGRIGSAMLLSAIAFGWLAWRTVTQAKPLFDGSVSVGWTFAPPLFVAAAGAIHVLPLAPSITALAFATIAGCLAATGRPDSASIPDYLRAQPAVLAGLAALAATAMVMVAMSSLAGPGQGAPTDAKWGGYNAPYLWPVAAGLTLVGLVAVAAVRTTRQAHATSTLPWTMPLVLALVWLIFAPLDTGSRVPMLGTTALAPINVEGMPSWILLGLIVTAIIALASPFTAGARTPHQGTDPARICAATVGGLAILSAGAVLAIEFEHEVGTRSSLYHPARSWAALVALLVGATVFRDLALWAYLRDAKWARYPRLTWAGALFVWWVAVPQVLVAGQIDVGHFIWLAVPPAALFEPIQIQFLLLAAVSATAWGLVLWVLGHRTETHRHIEPRSRETEVSESDPSKPQTQD